MVPKILPSMLANKAYNTYLNEVSKTLYPIALKVPIWFLSSSTILVIEVKLTKAATKKNIKGKILAIFSILSVSSLNS